MSRDPNEDFLATITGAVRFTQTLDAGRLVRCANCRHPHRAIAGDACRHCGRSLDDGTPTTEAVYRASRADSATVPYAEDLA